MDRMELQKIPNEVDDSSNDSLSGQYTEPFECEKATINSQFCDEGAESQRFLPNGVTNKKYEASHEEYHPGHASFGMSVFNLSNAIMGSGILGLSYAMANTGILLFIILLLSVAILSLYSIHLLLMTAKEGRSLIYETLGERAFGWPGKMVAFGSITLQNIGAMSSYLFIVKYELPEVIRAFMGLEEISGEWYLNGNYLVVFVSMGIIMPLSLLKSLGYLGYTSGFSLSCMVFFLAVLMYKKTQVPCPLPILDHHSSNHSLNGSLMLPHLLPNASGEVGFARADLPMPPAPPSLPSDHVSEVHYEEYGSNDMCTPKYFVFNSQTVYTVPILAFAFVCHPEVLPIYSELKERSRRKMQRVSNLSILAMLVMYMMSALFGYLTFYENVEPELLHTFTKVYRFDTLLLMVRVAVLMAVTLTVPIVLFPIRSSIVTLFFTGKRFSWIRHILIAAAILTFNNLLVIFVPSIRDIFGFIGATAATMLIFIMPSAFYLRLVKSLSFRSPQKILATIFLIMGLIFMMGSLSLIVLDWIHNPPGTNGH
ncbi:sodium-coupled neutral amino acid transporter 4-like isoform X1 [Paramormyrops kingsleyae]|uniref:Solute carrier family 38 member 4 n=1 Tax=Paramormyrops kingsleyae TaxID=1676925 RepID=A0A3B3QZD6_9TELE|nr:sodium-coupled neutral amino acid transporter 4-like [Paramormyrops kingsleyae]XP_023664634.1 sodium-coupled neutral amino acid transporter 4-like [Paramormyrops kingsleyae]XP_023664635.1 sodium-coupled neutral amino acid transporter 4-like [Paramormyrops kingsleyae]XP_023664636.1 sodium-coupled neutral amino acid transporter 4-like [Paramormyrops kingsleyae]XP_023664637.1 sodium-coupled neutral amino acid transporter 4-like [Paramormyrops kingsleyae]XP_023664638.1 sodium-coupled neutral am